MAEVFMRMVLRSIRDLLHSIHMLGLRRRPIRLTSVSFLASIALLVILFFGLLVRQVVLEDRQTRAIIRQQCRIF